MAAGPAGEVPDLGRQVHEALLARGHTVGCAESLTGGELATLLSRSAGASATFVGGVVAYSAAVKRSVLGVTAAHVVSADCAEQMAQGARRLLDVDWAISTTGVAGPDPQEGQRVGTVYVGVAGPTGTRSLPCLLEGDRGAIRLATCGAAARLLLDEVRVG